MSGPGEAGKYELPPPIFSQGSRTESSRGGELAGVRLMPFSTLFFGALLGGSITVILLSLLDARSLGRLRRDGLFYLSVIVLSAVLLGGSYYLATVNPMPPWMAQLIGKVDFRFVIWFPVTRGYAIALCFVLWVQYWRYYKIADSWNLSRDVVLYRELPIIFFGSLFELFMVHTVFS